MRELRSPRVDLDGSRVLVGQTDGATVIRTVHDADIFEEVFRVNHELRAESKLGHTSRGNTQKHRVKIATIPITYYFHLLSTFGEPDSPERVTQWRKALNDSSMEKFRTTTGVI